MKPERTFSEEEVAAIKTRERRAGERAGRRAVAAQLGIPPERFDPAAVRALLRKAGYGRPVPSRRNRPGVPGSAPAAQRDRGDR